MFLTENTYKNKNDEKKYSGSISGFDIQYQTNV